MEAIIGFAEAVHMVDALLALAHVHPNSHGQRFQFVHALKPPVKR